MGKLYLEIPTIDRKEEAIEYIQENLDANSDINGVGGNAIEVMSGKLL